MHNIVRAKRSFELRKTWRTSDDVSFNYPYLRDLVLLVAKPHVSSFRMLIRYNASGYEIINDKEPCIYGK